MLLSKPPATVQSQATHCPMILGVKWCRNHRLLRALSHHVGGNLRCGKKAFTDRMAENCPVKKKKSEKYRFFYINYTTFCR